MYHCSEQYLDGALQVEMWKQKTVTVKFESRNEMQNIGLADRV